MPLGFLQSGLQCLSMAQQRLTSMTCTSRALLSLLLPAPRKVTSASKCSIDTWCMNESCALPLACCCTHRLLGHYTPSPLSVLACTLNLQTAHHYPQFL